MGAEGRRHQYLQIVQIILMSGLQGVQVITAFSANWHFLKTKKI